MKTKNLFKIAFFFINSNLIFAQAFLEKGIRVNQTVEEKVIPDRVILEVILEENKSKKKLETLKKDLNQIVKTADLSLYKSKLKIPKNVLKKNSIVYELKIKTDQIQEIIKSLKEKNIFNIFFIKADYTKKEELEKELEQEAIKKAKEKAERILSSINKKLGKIKAIHIRAYPMRGYQASSDYDYREKNSKLEEVGELSIDLSLLIFNMDLDITFEIK